MLSREEEKQLLKEILLTYARHKIQHSVTPKLEPIKKDIFGCEEVMFYGGLGRRIQNGDNSRMLNVPPF